MLMSVVRVDWAEMALLVTSHRNIAPSSCFLGISSSTLTVWPSLWSARVVLPIICAPSDRRSQEMSGGGEPPALEQVRLYGSPSTASGLDLVMVGVPGGRRTVRLTVAV